MNKTASGAPTSNFFNIFTATSVTSSGQSLISTTETAFEAFLTNNVPFLDLDDCMNFLNNVLNEKYKINDWFLPNISKKALKLRLVNMFKEYSYEYDSILDQFILKLNQKSVNRIYFKNNLYVFSKIPLIRNKLDKILSLIKEYETNDSMTKEEITKIGKKEFKDPNEVPEVVKDDIQDLWEYYKQFVFYNNFAFNRIERLKHEKRKTVVTVDTDS